MYSALQVATLLLYDQICGAIYISYGIERSNGVCELSLSKETSKVVNLFYNSHVSMLPVIL
jgi:hypothetical protein